jgi:hypothetical protein
LLLAGADGKLQRQEKVKRGSGNAVTGRFYVLDQKILDDAAGT